MTANVIPNRIRLRDSVAPAMSIKDSGEPYSYRMFFDNNSRIADADSLDDLVDVILPGYLMASEEDQSKMRLDYAIGREIDFRTHVLSRMSPGEFSDLLDWEREYLLSTYATTLTWEDENDTFPRVWSSDVPLVLINAFYAPYGEVTRPLSKYGDFDLTPNTLWFNVESDISFLDSLMRMGIITYGTPTAEGRRLPKRDRKKKN